MWYKSFKCLTYLPTGKLVVLEFISKSVWLHSENPLSPVFHYSKPGFFQLFPVYIVSEECCYYAISHFNCSCNWSVEVRKRIFMHKKIYAIYVLLLTFKHVFEVYIYRWVKKFASHRLCLDPSILSPHHMFFLKTFLKLTLYVWTKFTPLPHIICTWYIKLYIQT